MMKRRLGKYELQQQLGSDHIGELWRVYDHQARQDVLLKLFHPDLQSDPNFMARLTSEGKAITALHHPHITRVREIDVTRSPDFGGSIAYMAMDFIEGETLADYIARTSRKGKFPPIDEIVYLFTCLGAAIDYAHEHGVRHGMIHPGAIMFDRQHTTVLPMGEPMLGDFGVARLVGNTATINNNPNYIAPEQAKGQEGTERSDIYSLGVILYELCTGILPFHGDSPVVVMMHQINTLPTPPMLINPNISPALSDVILRALAKDAGTRFSMASLQATALAEACSMRISSLSSRKRPTVTAPLPTESAEETQVPILGVSVIAPRAPTTSGLQPIVRPLTPAPAARMTESQKQPVFAHSTPTLVATRQPALSTPISTPSARYPARTRKRSFMYGLIYVALLALVVLSGIVVGINLLHRTPSLTGATASPVIGHVFFQDDALGNQDVLHIVLQQIPTPPTGMVYYGWLQEAGKQNVPMGALKEETGTFTSYYTDPQHRNLLAPAQGVFITEEKSGSPPAMPANKQVYVGSFTAATFQYIKNILYSLAGFPANNSIAAGLVDNIKSINEKATSIVDTLQGNHDYPLIQRQATRIIEAIDGTAYAQSSKDLPTPFPSIAYSPVGLISSPVSQGYIDTLAAQIQKLEQVAGNDATLHQHINNVNAAITDLRDWVQKMRTYDVQILHATNLGDPAILDVALQLKKLAADTYVGRTIPPNEGPLPIAGSAGANQAYVECQYMATLDLRALA